MNFTQILERINTRQYGMIATLLTFLFAVNTLYRAWTYKNKAVEAITVVGGAEKTFESDLIQWSGSYSKSNVVLRDAHTALKQDESNIRAYLKSKGIADSEMIFNSVNIDKQFNRTYGENGQLTSETFAGYNLTQSVTVESKDINKVEKLSREITDLLQTGIEFNSSSPSYYYTKLKDLKIALLASASEDAYTRAKTVAQSSHSSLGDLKKAVVGVFQITGQNSDEAYTYGGAFNTTDRHKKASITIRQDYSIN